MTNLEHYGFNNLIFDEYGFIVEIYYKTKHSKDNILLIRRAPDDPREFKVKWLLEEYTPWVDPYPSEYIIIVQHGENGGCWVRGYRMKHVKYPFIKVIG